MIDEDKSVSSWTGRVAYINTPTSDGRILHSSPPMRADVLSLWLVTDDRRDLIGTVTKTWTVGNELHACGDIETWAATAVQKGNYLPEINTLGDTDRKNIELIGIALGQNPVWEGLYIEILKER